MALDIKAILERIRDTRISKSFNIGRCKVTIGCIDGAAFALQGVRLESKDRGKGEATRALTALLVAIDSLGSIIRLQVQPMDKKTDKDGLIRLYTRLGFKRIHDRNKTYYVIMQRKPQKKKATPMSLESLSRQLAIAGVTHTIVTSESEKFNVPDLSSWKYDDSLAEKRFYSWNWNPVHGQRVTISMTTTGTGRLPLGEAKVSTFNFPGKGASYLMKGANGKIKFAGVGDRGEEAVFKNHKEAFKAFKQAYKNAE